MSIDEDVRGFNNWKKQSRLAQRTMQAFTLGVVLMASSSLGEAGALFTGPYSGINSALSTTMNHYWADSSADD